VLSRLQAPDLTVIALMLEVCAAAVDACATECARHAPHHTHCDVAAAACHRCYESCRMLMASNRPYQTH
jgi:hypothetical protein